ncbi:MAG TPA: type I-C CRISPR-associated endonuclease Cas1c [Spirochaetia bacterium]|nr:type I-C CRISPR-associated endonuclease Cas1c [Spirochaetia bacterium]
MKRFLNTLFVMTQKSYLKKDGETVVVVVNKVVKLRVPLLTIQGIVCFGNVTISPFLAGAATEHGVTITFLSAYGRFLARMEGPVSGNVLLRRAQYRLSDDRARTAAVVRNILTGKLMNCKTVLQRSVRDHGDKIDGPKVQKAIQRFDRELARMEAVDDVDELRGIEGEMGRAYFDVFDDLITAQKADFTFKTRTRRPPLDRVNALLSFCYTLLYHDMRSACETVGLDPSVGFLHRDRPGRHSLALDLMEEMRPFFADRLVLSMINLRQVDAGSFTVSESGAVLLNENGRKVVVTAYQKRKQAVIMHPFVHENMHIGVLFQSQALLMARFIRGDMDAYAPFLWR